MATKTITRRMWDLKTKHEAVRRVLVLDRPQAEVAREMGIHDGTVNNWVALARANPTAWGLPPPPEKTLPQSEVARVFTEHRNLGADIGFSDGVEAMRAAVLGTLYGFRATSGVSPEAEYDRLMVAVRRMDVTR